MKQFACRRKFAIEINDSETREVVDDVIVLDPKREIKLFPKCETCGYGKKLSILESRNRPFTTYTARSCRMRRVE